MWCFSRTYISGLGNSTSERSEAVHKETEREPAFFSTQHYHIAKSALHPTLQFLTGLSYLLRKKRGKKKNIMQLKTSLATLALASGLAAAYDPTPFVGPLQPWKITDLTISLPPSRLGADGIVTIKVHIENPNQVSAGPAPGAEGGGYLPFQPTSADCVASGPNQYSSLTGYCNNTAAAGADDGTAGAFELAVVPPSNGNSSGPVDPNGFEVKFSLAYNVTRWNAHWDKLYEGQAAFGLNNNLVLGKCANRENMCSYTLNPDKAPLQVAPTMVECTGTCSNDP
ncbi:hypothetical protein F5B19DRAFT_440146 [Rostrohypoxylon terebratum]|nr:hypothetical protein F5B19DRAFT_440146 [Rostrohypoxylon terebratum]